MAEVLLVGADRGLVRSVARALEARGHSLERVEGLDEALDVLTERRDAIVCSLELRDGSAHDLLEAIRVRELRTPVLVLATFAPVTDATALRRAGAWDVLCSPFGEAELLGMVDRLVGLEASPSNLIDVLRDLHRRSADAQIRVGGGPLVVLEMRGGELVHAECDGCSPRAALVGALARDVARCTVDERAPAPETRSLELPFQHLLLQSLAELEARER